LGEMIKAVLNLNFVSERKRIHQVQNILEMETYLGEGDGSRLVLELLKGEVCTGSTTSLDCELDVEALRTVEMGSPLRICLQFSMRISTITFANLMSIIAATVSSSALKRVGPKQTARLETVIMFCLQLSETYQIIC